MGLDMYVSVTNVPLFQDVDFELRRDQYEDFHIFPRNYWGLYSVMERLYICKGGNSRAFNCDKMRLTLRDLATLEKYIMQQPAGYFEDDNDEPDFA
jgi:hypothetical protein